MKCWVYKSLKKDDMYVYLAQEDGFEKMPETLRQGFGRAEFVMKLTLNKERSLAREEVSKVMENLQAQGFHLQLPTQLIPDLYTGD